MAEWTGRVDDHCFLGSSRCMLGTDLLGRGPGGYSDTLTLCGSRDRLHALSHFISEHSYSWVPRLLQVTVSVKFFLSVTHKDVGFTDVSGPALAV